MYEWMCGYSRQVEKSFLSQVQIAVFKYCDIYSHGMCDRRAKKVLEWQKRREFCEQEDLK